MKNYYLRIKEWWQHLGPREQKLVSYGGIITLLLLFFAFIWLPEMQFVSLTRNKIPHTRNLVVWMQAADRKLSLASHENNDKPILTPVGLLSTLQNRINRMNMQNALQQLKQISNEAIELNFNEVEFDNLISLLLETCKNPSVKIEQLSASASKNSGMVKARVVLKLEG